MKNPLDVLDITRLAIQKYHADGLCNGEMDCGCSTNHLAPCGDGPLPDCCLATALVIPEMYDDGDLLDLLHPQTGEKIFHDSNPGDIIYVPLLVEDEQ